MTYWQKGCRHAIRIQPILNHDVLAEGLSSHPDAEFVSCILDNCVNGVPIGYEGPRSFRDCRNWPSATQFHDKWSHTISNDIALSRKFGPFDHPPFNNFVASPMGAFCKRSGKVRVIQDLSWPPDRSINDYISSKDYTVTYISVDDITRRIQMYGPHTLMDQLDIADAFRHILVRKEDWELLSTVFEKIEHGTVIKQYYFDVVLPFGLRSSPKLISDFADALQHIMLSRGVSECFHYMDDYITMGPPSSSQCRTNLEVMLKTCADVGFSVNPQKVVGPSTVLEYLGFIIDTDAMQIRISQDRLQRIIAELCAFEIRQVCTKRELLSLIGKLIFIAKVVRSGRTFVRCLIERSKRAKHLHNLVKLDQTSPRVKTW